MTVSSRLNVVQLLEADHLELEDLFDRLESTAPEHRRTDFCHLAEALIRHEVAEEVVVFPALAASGVPGGLASANARRAEQAELEILLAETAATDLSTRSFAQLRFAVNRHSELEEFGAFSLLFAAVGSQTLIDLGSRYARAKSASPQGSHLRALHGTDERASAWRVHHYVHEVRVAVRSAA
jgi:hypothetical protein